MFTQISHANALFDSSLIYLYFHFLSVFLSFSPRHQAANQHLAPVGPRRAGWPRRDHLQRERHPGREDRVAQERGPARAEPAGGHHRRGQGAARTRHHAGNVVRRGIKQILRGSINHLLNGES